MTWGNFWLDLDKQTAVQDRQDGGRENVNKHLPISLLHLSVEDTSEELLRQLSYAIKNQRKAGLYGIRKLKIFQ